MLRRPSRVANALDVGRFSIRHGREGAGDTEIGELDVAVASDQDVTRLHVPMSQAASVDGSQSARHPGRSASRAPGRHGSVALQESGQVLPVDVLGDEVCACAVRAEVVYGHDVLVVKAGRRSSLPAKVGQEIEVLGVLGPQQLDLDVSIELRVLSAELGGIRALTEQLYEPVAAPDHLSDLGQERSSPSRCCSTGHCFNYSLARVRDPIGSQPMSRVCRYCLNSLPMSCLASANSTDAFSQPIVVPASYRTPSKA